MWFDWQRLDWPSQDDYTCPLAWYALLEALSQFDGQAPVSFFGIDMLLALLYVVGYYFVIRGRVAPDLFLWPATSKANVLDLGLRQAYLTHVFVGGQDRTPCSRKRVSRLFRNVVWLVRQRVSQPGRGPISWVCCWLRLLKLSSDNPWIFLLSHYSEGYIGLTWSYGCCIVYTGMRQHGIQRESHDW